MQTHSLGESISSDVMSSLLAANQALGGHSQIGDVRTFAFTADCKSMITGHTKQGVRLWDLTASEPLSESIELCPQTGVFSVALSPDRDFMACCNIGELRLWKRNGDSYAESYLLQQSGVVPSDLSFSNSGKFLFGSSDNAVHCWEVSRWTAGAKRFADDSEIESFATSPDERWLATGSRIGNVRLWDLSRSPATHVDLKCGSEQTVESVCFSRDSQWLAVAGPNSECRAWNLAGQTIDDTMVVMKHDGHPDEVSVRLRSLAGRNRQEQRSILEFGS